jgi:uncharacterized protein YutD
MSGGMLVTTTLPVERFNIAQMVSAIQLDEILVDPEFEAFWWEAFEHSYHQHLERYGAEPVTPWDWEVHRDQGSYTDEDTGEVYTWSGYVILGICRAIRR